MNNQPHPLGSPCTQTHTSTQFPLLYLSFIHHHTSPSRETSFPPKDAAAYALYSKKLSRTSLSWEVTLLPDGNVW